MAFAAELDESSGRLQLSGDCLMADAPALEHRLARLIEVQPRTLVVDLSAAGAIAIGPAWLLRSAISDLSARGTAVEFAGRQPEHFPFLDELAARDLAAISPARARRPAIGRVADLGRAIVGRARSGYTALVFGGAVLATAAVAWRSLKRLRGASIVRHVHETGVQAIPVVAVIAFLISVISGYIGAQQLRPYGAEIYTVDLVTIGVLRELGVLLTAIMVAGRTGSAYAAELGAMQLNDEVDALESMGMSPYEVLVLPRVLGLVIALPLLTVVADAMGLAGGALLTAYLLDLPWPQFLARLDASIADTTFWAGMVKAPVFGLLIALTGTLRGLQVRESSRELGRLTTVAVVQSIFLVIFADALFAVFFLEIDF